MSYQAARDGLATHRTGQIASLLGETGGSWFLDKWADVKAMLKDMASDEENATISATYASATAAKRAGAHIRLDYVCSLRREVRKQYVSGDGDICTDVTPFRHGVMSAHGADVFDKLMDAVVKHAESVE